ncbi:MAG: hypothetical protein ACR2PY_08620 [Salinispira sp.]
MQISVVNYSEVKKSPYFRLDSDYWHPEFIQNSKIVSPSLLIKDVVTKNIQNIKSSPRNNNFQYLEISRISLTVSDYEPIEVRVGEEPDRAHYILKKGDIAVSTVRPNRNAVAFIKHNEVIGSSGLSILRSDVIIPEYLYIFCKTNYFKKCLIRANKATMYPAVSNSDILDTPIFVPSVNFQEVIRDIAQKGFAQLEETATLCKQAENILLSELGLTHWQPKHQLTFIKNYSDTVQTGRIDADYYQPKYEELVKAIQSYSGGWDELKNLATIKDKNFEPKNKKQYKYIELANIAGWGEISDYMVEYGQSLPTRARRKVSTGDVVVSSIEGSLSHIAIIEKQFNNELCSTGFHVVEPTYFNSETLLVLMKSFVGQLQLKKGCCGTILTSISKKEVEKIALPKIQKTKQNQIRQKITESFNLRKQSRHLLECAKRGVEIAIEQNEQTAIQWLENEINKIQK